MKLQLGIAIILAAAFVLLPVLAVAAESTETESVKRLILDQNPEMSNHYGYITVKSLDVNLYGVNAVYTVNYSIDPWIAFLVFLLGKQDLKNRLMKIINTHVASNGHMQEIVFHYVDNEKTVFSISNAAMSYGDNTYWYPEQEFAVTIPQITFTSSFTKTYNNTRVIELGFGYY